MEWILIYNDGKKITTVSSKDKTWNEAPSNNVQFKIIIKDGIRYIITGRDVYWIREPNTDKKIGTYISDEQYKRTRTFMIYGDY